MKNEYELLDSGEGQKLERFGDIILSRPCDQAFWRKQQPALWTSSDATFERAGGWTTHSKNEIPSSWIVPINGITMKLKLTPAGQVGVFPETRQLWDWITDTLKSAAKKDLNVLNLFAYSGGATLAAARAGCSVCHLDASRSVVTRARENANLNQLDQAPVRWIIEDVNKFLDREISRGRQYDAIMLDPPSYGHGRKGEQYKIKKDLPATLEKCKALMSDNPLFILLTSHTIGMTKEQLEMLMIDQLGIGNISCGEMKLTGANGVRSVNSGLWTRWSPRV